MARKQSCFSCFRLCFDIRKTCEFLWVNQVQDMSLVGKQSVIQFCLHFRIKRVLNGSTVLSSFTRSSSSTANPSLLSKDDRYLEAEKLLQNHRLVKMASNNALSHVGGHRCYALLGDAARLEKALMSWTLKKLVKEYNFTPVVVPTLVYDDVVSSCGFDPHGKRTQVYSVDGLRSKSNEASSSTTMSENQRSVCLTGTSEIPLVSLHLGKRFDVSSLEASESLPKRYTAISRCYRAETSNVEKGLYRLHYFSKLEMLSLCQPQESEEILQEFISIQKTLFSQLGLSYQVIDIPPEELGPTAVKKVDIEAWFPGRKVYGEISSASNCCQRQTEKLDIRLRRMKTEDELNRDDCDDPFVEDFVHSVNGTACASPRILLPLVETHQTRDGRIAIPSVLRSEMNGQEFLNKFTL